MNLWSCCPQSQPQWLRKIKKISGKIRTTLQELKIVFKNNSYDTKAMFIFYVFDVFVICLYVKIYICIDNLWYLPDSWLSSMLLRASNTNSRFRCFKLSQFRIEKQNQQQKGKVVKSKYLLRRCSRCVLGTFLGSKYLFSRCLDV